MSTQVTLTLEPLDSKATHIDSSNPTISFGAENPIIEGTEVIGVRDLASIVEYDIQDADQHVIDSASYDRVCSTPALINAPDEDCVIKRLKWDGSFDHGANDIWDLDCNYTKGNSSTNWNAAGATGTDDIYSEIVEYFAPLVAEQLVSLNVKAMVDAQLLGPDRIAFLGRTNLTLGAGNINWQFYGTGAIAAKRPKLIIKFTVTTPTIGSTAVLFVWATSARATASITSAGNGSGQKGFVYATHPNPTIADNVAQIGLAVSDSGSYTIDITGLPAGVKQYIRAFSSNQDGITYDVAGETSFTTYDLALAVDLDAAISGSITTDNFGKSDNLYVGKLSKGGLFGTPRRTIMAVDLSIIARTITEARLRINAVAAAGSAATLRLRRIADHTLTVLPFVEGTGVTGSPADGICRANYDGVNAWGTAWVNSTGSNDAGMDSIATNETAGVMPTALGLKDYDITNLAIDIKYLALLICKSDEVTANVDFQFSSRTGAVPPVLLFRLAPTVESGGGTRSDGTRPRETFGAAESLRADSLRPGR